MSICSDKHHDKPSSCRQIFMHVRESETPMRDVRNLLLEILTQYREADKIGSSLGVLDKCTSLTDAVSWCAILGKLDHDKATLDKASKQHLGYSVEHLEEMANGLVDKVVTPIQKNRDKWMKRVLFWDLIVFALLLMLVVAGMYLTGTGLSLDAITSFFQQRPVFSAVSILSGVAVMIGIHYLIRRLVMNHLLDNLEEKLFPGMSMANALRRNARIQHSIFRPDPVGWNFRQRKRLKSITCEIAEIQKQLAEVLANYPDQKAA